MFKEPTILYYTVPKSKHYILSGLATLLAMLSCALTGLSIGTDHWREKDSPDYNSTTKVLQGLIHECDRKSNEIVCKSITLSRFMRGVLGAVEIPRSILIGSVVFGLASLLISLLASLHKKHVLVTAVVALEIASALATLFAISLYTHHFKDDMWSFGWSYGLSWLAFLSMTVASISHFIVQDAKFLGKKICV